MKTCPDCNFQMEDSLRFCPNCGVDYIAAIESEITVAANVDVGLMLANLEEGLTRIDNAPLPTSGQTLRKLTPAVCGILLLFLLLSGIITGANIFYILAAAISIPFVLVLIARSRGNLGLSSGEVLIRATARIFDEDAASVRERFAGDEEVMTSLEAMRQRIDEALGLQAAAHARNRKKICIILAVVLALCAVGVGALAMHKHARQQAAAEYAAQPEWIKLRDRYLESGDADEATRKELRERVLAAMVAADQITAAEEFFFSQSQGQIGDLDCALLIARYYADRNDKASLNSFADKVKLRYDSDTQKVKNLKK